MEILNNSIVSEKFGNLLVEAGLHIDDMQEKEWDIANKLLGKSDEISHAAGGKERKVIH